MGTTEIVGSIAIIASIISIIVNVNLKHKVDLKMTQYSLTHEEQSKILGALFELELFLDSLSGAYPNQVDLINPELPLKHREKYNRLVTTINKGLSRLFIIMPDNRYLVFEKEWKSGKMTLKNLREVVTILMRKSQFPKTKYNLPKNIKLIHKVK